MLSGWSRNLQWPGTVVVMRKAVILRTELGNFNFSDSGRMEAVEGNGSITFRWMDVAEDHVCWLRPAFPGFCY